MGLQSTLLPGSFSGLLLLAAADWGSSCTNSWPPSPCTSTTTASATNPVTTLTVIQLEVCCWHRCLRGHCTSDTSDTSSSASSVQLSLSVPLHGRLGAGLEPSAHCPHTDSHPWGCSACFGEPWLLCCSGCCSCCVVDSRLALPPLTWDHICWCNHRHAPQRLQCAAPALLLLLLRGGGGSNWHAGC